MLFQLCKLLSGKLFLFAQQLCSCVLRRITEGCVGKIDPSVVNFSITAPKF